MARPTPTFTARSRQGKEALETARRNGEALERAGRWARFVCGTVVGAVLGFFVVSNLWSGEPIVRAWLDEADAGGYWLLVTVIAVATGFASVRWGTRAWRQLYELWYATWSGR